MTKEATLLLMVGGQGPSEVEQALEGAHQAAARDLLEIILDTGLVDRAIVATDNPDWGSTLADLPVVIIDPDPPGEPFHFGQRLVQLIERYEVQRVLYSGGGSAPLLSVQQWADVLDQLKKTEHVVITNNLHSCDWLGFMPTADTIPLIARQTNDNGLAWALTNGATLPTRSLPASAATRFDLDTPIDLLMAHHHPGIGPHLRSFLDELDWKSPQLDSVLTEMSREGGSLAVIGRVSSAAWATLERATRCWVRIFAEERGMRASGRQQRGEVRSLLADYLELTGTEGFFDELANLANGVLIDNRVILAAKGLWPTTLDRFNADLYRWREVKNPFLRSFTRAAVEAQIPIVMGGHSVVAGGLMALADIQET